MTFVEGVAVPNWWGPEAEQYVLVAAVSSSEAGGRKPPRDLFEPSVPYRATGWVLYPLRAGPSG